MSEDWFVKYIIEKLTGGKYTKLEELTARIRSKLKCPKCSSLVWELYEYHEDPEYVGKVNFDDMEIDEAEDIINQEYIIRCNCCGHDQYDSLLEEEEIDE